MKNSSIVFITENYIPGGANKYTEDLINAVEGQFEEIYILGNKEAIASFDKSRIPSRSAYITISIFNISEKVKKYNRPQRLFLKLLLLPVSLFINLVSYLSLAFFILSKNPDRVILCNGGYPASIFLIFSLLFISKKNNPILTIVSTPTTSTSAIAKKIWKIINSMVQKKTHMLAVNSHAIKKEMIEKLHFSAEKIAIIRNGVSDLSICKTMEKSQLTLGFVSRVEKSKGIQELLDAYEKLSHNHDNLELVVVGSGSQDSLVKKASEKNSSIRVMGHISGDLTNVLKEIDIFILPSYQEGLPYSVIEACMAKCTVVATNVGGIPEIITHNQSGLLVPPMDANALYEALQLVVNDADLRKKLASEARKSYEENFTFFKMKEQAQLILN